MAIITMPTNLLIGGASVGQARFDMTEQSDSTGAQAARLLGPPRWTLALQSLPNMSLVEAAKWETMLFALRGRVNVLAAFDPVRLAPQGTMRGTLTLNNPAAAGDVSLYVTGGSGQASTTLLGGDWLQVGTGLGTSQLVKVIAAATANGSGLINVSIEPPIRMAFAGGTAVAWSMPLGYYRAQNDAQKSSYVPGFISQGGFAVDLLEAFG